MTMTTVLDVNKHMLALFSLEGRPVTKIELTCVHDALPLLVTHEDILGFPMPRRQEYNLVAIPLTKKPNRFKRRYKMRKRLPSLD